MLIVNDSTNEIVGEKIIYPTNNFMIGGVVQD